MTRQSETVPVPEPVRAKALAAGAMLDGGVPAVLKLVVPRAGNLATREITALRLANGEGMVRRWLAEFIGTRWEELDGPCTVRTVDHALVCAAQDT